MRSRAFVTRLSISLSPAAFMLLAHCEPMDGCPWVETTPVTITPSEACLTVVVPDGSDPDASGGCVNPVLRGTNGCEETLTIPADPDGGWPEQIVQPGGTIDLELLLDANVDTRNDRFFFEVPATLGDTPIVFAFETSRDD